MNQNTITLIASSLATLSFLIFTLVQILTYREIKKLAKESKKFPSKNNSLDHKPKSTYPCLSLQDFKVGDIVSTKPGVIPGGRYKQPIEYIGPQQVFGETQIAIRVMSMPYLPEELILHKDEQNTK